MPKVECICQECGVKFWENPSIVESGRGKFCCRECYHISKRVECECQECGVKFLIYPSLVKRGMGKRCKECRHISKKVECECQECGVKFLIKPSLIKKGMGKYCSRPQCKSKSMSITAKKNWKNLEYREIIIISMKKSQNLPEYKIKHSNMLKERWSDDEFRNKMCKINKEVSNIPEYKIKCSNRMKERWSDDEFRNKMCNILKEITNTPEYKVKQSIAAKKNWDNDVFREKHRLSMIESKVGGIYYGHVTYIDRKIIDYIRCSAKYKLWYQQIIYRDQHRDFYTVEVCKYPEVHHIISIDKLIKKYNIKTLDEAIACEPLWDINNGMTLEKKNHIQWHNCHDGFRYVSEEDLEEMYE